MNTFALDKNYKKVNFEEITVDELEVISGGSGGYISGYQAAGAILAVLGAGAIIATAPISSPVLALAWGSAAGSALAQFFA